MNCWFTSDWHLGEDRIGINGKPNLFFRPFKSVVEQDLVIINNFAQSDFKDGDTLYHLGDVVYDDCDQSCNHLRYLRDRYPNSEFHLIVGNYDEDKLIKLTDSLFDRFNHWIDIELDEKLVLLNHYPARCKVHLLNWTGRYAITGHIHGLWRVQRDMINVGVDAWNFKPVSKEEILFTWNAMQHHYDENVFPY